MTKCWLCLLSGPTPPIRGSYWVVLVQCEWNTAGFIKIIQENFPPCLRLKWNCATHLLHNASLVTKALRCNALFLYPQTAKTLLPTDWHFVCHFLNYQGDNRMNAHPTTAHVNRNWLTGSNPGLLAWVWPDFVHMWKGYSMLPLCGGGGSMWCLWWLFLCSGDSTRCITCLYIGSIWRCY